MTKELEEEFKKVGSQEDAKDPIAVCRFFNPTGAGTWYVLSYDSKEKIFFGYVSFFGDWNDELGYFSLRELESFRGRMGLGIERDLHFTAKPLSQCGTTFKI